MITRESATEPVTISAGRMALLAKSDFFPVDQRPTQKHTPASELPESRRLGKPACNKGQQPQTDSSRQA